ncbi:hypothetical protein D041_4060A, partial [Vibrio parahaemolyticus EKP-008]
MRFSIHSSSNVPANVWRASKNGGTGPKPATLRFFDVE